MDKETNNSEPFVLKQYESGQMEQEIYMAQLPQAARYDIQLDFTEKHKARRNGSAYTPADLFTYLFARLGPTGSSCDPNKVFARYRLSTRIEGLAIEINIVGMPTIFMSKEIAIRYHDWRLKPIRAWWKRLTLWSGEEGKYYDQSVLSLKGDDKGKFELLIAADLVEYKKTLPELQAQLLNFEDMDSADKFWKWKVERNKKIMEEFEKREPLPIASGTFEEVYQWHHDTHVHTIEGDDTIGFDVFAAVNEVLDDLFRPVQLGGLAIDMFGRCGDDVLNELGFAPLWTHTGNGFIEKDIEAGKYNQFIDCMAIAFEVGKGDLIDGLNTVFLKYKNARVGNLPTSPKKGKSSK
jgi:hypothetical protein